MAKQQYYDGHNLVIAECERCGRGFVSLRKGLDMNTACDPFGPQRGSRYFGQQNVCGGRIVLLEPVATSKDQQ